MPQTLKIVPQNGQWFVLAYEGNAWWPLMAFGSREAAEAWAKDWIIRQNVFPYQHWTFGKYSAFYGRNPLEKYSQL